MSKVLKLNNSYIYLGLKFFRNYLKYTFTYCLVIILFIGMLSNPARATHIVGGELTAEYIRTVGGSWEYEVSFWIYRDCSSLQNFGFDDTLYITVFNSNNVVFRVDTILFNPLNRQVLDVIVDNPCLVAPPNICTELGFYQGRFLYPKNLGGYTLSFERCCRNAGILNIVTPGSVGSTYTTNIPGIMVIGVNPSSSPKFKQYPPMVLCIDDNISFDHSAFDKDGDSLVYELCTPFLGGGRSPLGLHSPNSPYPVPANPPPYTPLIWTPGFSINNMLVANPQLHIDSLTGLLTGKPTAIGQYVVGICVKEFRNGLLLSENKRDFQFTVTKCDPNSIAAASSQERFCDGLKVDFKNQSQNAISYFWDFGDPNSTSDTSNLHEPTYTYSDTGKFIITLIANPGYTCADTVYTVYEIYDLLQPFFERPIGQCFNQHSFDLKAGGEFQSYAQFEWDFGPFGVSSASFDQNPNGVKFTEPGAFPVTLFIMEDGCVEEYTDTILIFPDPTSKFNVPNRSACVPAIIKFENESVAWTEMYYKWDFGDGTSSSERSPTHVFTEPGIYDISLVTRTNEICSTAVKNVKYNYIKVNAIPKAELEVDRTVTSISDPYIKFNDASIGNRLCHLDLGDGMESVTCDYTHYYFKSGKFTVRQVVLSQFGCSDTNYIEITIRPQVALFIPNAFTPNDDTHNETYKPSGEIPEEFDFWIYNRSGKIVFYTTNIEKGWDGYYEGEPSPNDSYIYHIILKDALGEEYEFKGLFSLVR